MLVSGVLGPKSRSWFPWVLGSGVSGLGFWFTLPLVLSSRPRVTGSGVLCPGSWGPRSRVRGPHLRLWPSSIETIFQKKKTSFVVVYIHPGMNTSHFNEKFLLPLINKILYKEKTWLLIANVNVYILNIRNKSWNF